MDESTTLFLGDLSVFCTEKDIRKLFRSFGAIEAIRVKRGNSNKTNLSYGFIKFIDREAATSAFQQLNGVMFLGRALRIGWAEGKGGQKLLSDDMYAPKKGDTAQIHVSFISKQVDMLISEATLRGLFGMYGEVADVALKKSQFDKNLRVQNGYGFVHYPFTPDGIRAALTAVQCLHQVTIDRVTYDCSISHALQQYLIAVNDPTLVPYRHTHPVDATAGSAHVDSEESYADVRAVQEGPSERERQSMINNNMSMPLGVMSREPAAHAGGMFGRPRPAYEQQQHPDPPYAASYAPADSRHSEYERAPPRAEYEGAPHGHPGYGQPYPRPMHGGGYYGQPQMAYEHGPSQYSGIPYRSNPYAHHGYDRPMPHHHQQQQQPHHHHAAAQHGYPSQSAPYGQSYNPYPASAGNQPTYAPQSGRYDAPMPGPRPIGSPPQQDYGMAFGGQISPVGHGRRTGSVSSNSSDEDNRGVEFAPRSSTSSHGIHERIRHNSSFSSNSAFEGMALAVPAPLNSESPRFRPPSYPAPPTYATGSVQETYSDDQLASSLQKMNLEQASGIGYGGYHISPPPSAAIDLPSPATTNATSSMSSMNSYLPQPPRASPSQSMSMNGKLAPGGRITSQYSYSMYSMSSGGSSFRDLLAERSSEDTALLDCSRPLADAKHRNSMDSLNDSVITLTNLTFDDAFAHHSGDLLFQA